MNPYEVLGISENASEEEIKKAASFAQADGFVSNKQSVIYTLSVH